MLICTKCNVEYEEGKKFCKTCGTPLVVKEKPQSLEPIGHARLKETEGLLLCPQCQTRYKTGKYCRKCGSALIKPTPPQQKEGPGAIYQPVAKTESIEVPPLERVPFQEPDKLVCPNCKASYPSGKFCKKCGGPLTLKSEIEKIVVEPLMGTQRGAFQETPLPKPPEQKPAPPVPPIKIEEPKTEAEVRIPEKKPNAKETLSVKKKLIFRPLYIGVASTIVLIAVAGYLLWPKYSHLIKRQPPSPPTTQPFTSQQSEAKEIEAIKNLLENIRQANLQKNIDLFMSCYSTEFKDREGRKAATLDNWRDFDYLDLSYDLKTHSIAGDTANVKVEWSILTSPKGGGQTKKGEVILDVKLNKEGGSWKIIETKSAS